MEIEKNNWDSLIQTFNDGMRDVLDFTQELKSLSTKIHQDIAKIGNDLNEIGKGVNKFNVLANSMVEAVPEWIKEILEALAREGWYVDLELDLSIEDFVLTLDAINEHDTLKLTKEMVKYFDRRAKAIENEVIDKIPHRADILSSAFKAHHSSEYNLSIPVLLAQADGIAQENMKGISPFSKKTLKSTAKYASNLNAHPAWIAIFHPLTIETPLIQSKSFGFDRSVILNRHGILHGDIDALNYGTKINSLKAISVLNYIVQMLVPQKSDYTMMPTSSPLDGERPRQG